MSQVQSSTPVNGTGAPARTNFHEPTPPFDPNRELRPCASCGFRDQWRQLHALGGGWACACSARRLLLLQAEAERGRGGTLAHTCSPACILTGVGGAA